MKVVVVGGGVGGLTAASRLAALGHSIVLFEARDQVGGLASGLEAGGLTFDGGPYILLDRPGLEWALERIGLDVSPLNLIAVEELYEVRDGDEAPVRVYLDLQRTAAEMQDGRAYIRFVEEMESMRQKLAPMLRVSHPGLVELARRGSLSAAPFLLRSLRGVLGGSGLPPRIQNAIAIWTYIAGQTLEHAPSVMAFIPALIHNVGAFVPAGGMRAIPALLAEHAKRTGVEIRCRSTVKRIRGDGVELESGEVITCDAVVSNYNGIGTYDELVDVPERVRRRLRAIPLQSPGSCAYISAHGEQRGPYLRFVLDENRRAKVRVMSLPTVRLISPGGDDAFDDSWWRDGLTGISLVATRTVSDWGRELHLYRNSMNPVMTRQLMLGGRLDHRSPWVKGLYLAGASTHPGQWVSFCAISGVLAAEALHADRGR